MKKTGLFFTLFILLLSCSSNPEKDRIEILLKNSIKGELPFNDIKIAQIENGTGVIVDGSWCYWISNNNIIYCVNGMSQTLMRDENKVLHCDDAPIEAMFSDIEKIAQ